MNRASAWTGLSARSDEDLPGGGEAWRAAGGVSRYQHQRGFKWAGRGRKYSADVGLHLQFYEVVAILLKAGADINAKNVYERTVLMWAAMYYEIPNKIIALLDASADAKLKDKKGKMAFDCAQENWRFADTEAYRRLQEASQ